MLTDANYLSSQEYLHKHSSKLFVGLTITTKMRIKLNLITPKFTDLPKKENYNLKEEKERENFLVKFIFMVSRIKNYFARKKILS